MNESDVREGLEVQLSEGGDGRVGRLTGRVNTKLLLHVGPARAEVRWANGSTTWPRVSRLEAVEAGDHRG